MIFIKVTKMDDYEFEVEEGNIIHIVFENGEFSRCSFGFSGTYTREQWKILAAIEKKITELELSYSSNTVVSYSSGKYDKVIMP